MTRGFVALCIISALLGGGLAHSLVSHDHGHSHTAGESSIWASLHSSLRHEDKKSPVILSEGAIFVLFALLAASGARLVSLLALAKRAQLRDPYAQNALRRGIFKYRKFG